ncbi:MAG TPA: hypothetical protein PKA37_14465, partial [Planctomycetota bacterium]|nr:hypothetical protein [Planctomycetota bacterium]
LTESHFLASIFAYPVLRLLKDPFVAIVVTSLLAYVLLLILTFNWSYGQSGGSVLCACLTTLLLGTSPAIRAHMIRPFFWCLPLLLLVLLLSLRHLKKPSIPRSLAFGFALGLLPWASSHGTVFAVGMLLVLGVVHLVADWALVGWAVVRGLPGLALAAILGFYPMFKQWRAVNGATAGVGDVRGADEGFTLLGAAEWMDRAGVGHFHSTIQWSGIASVAFVIIGILTARAPRVSGDSGSAHPSSFILHPSSFILHHGRRGPHGYRLWTCAVSLWRLRTPSAGRAPRRSRGDRERNHDRECRSRLHISQRGFWDGSGAMHLAGRKRCS